MAARRETTAGITNKMKRSQVYGKLRAIKAELKRKRRAKRRMERELAGPDGEVEVEKPRTLDNMRVVRLLGDAACWKSMRTPCANAPVLLRLQFVCLCAIFV